MFGDHQRLSPLSDFDDYFMNATSSFRNDFNSPVLNSGLRLDDPECIFHRMFPLRADDHFKNIPLRQLSSGDVSSRTTSIVRNIPIKIEKSNSADFRVDRYGQQSAKVGRHFQIGGRETTFGNEKFFSGGRLSPPPPPHHKHFNSAVNNVNHDCQSVTSQESKLKHCSQPDNYCKTTPPVPSNRRPVLAPKPKFNQVPLTSKTLSDQKQNEKTAKELDLIFGQHFIDSSSGDESERTTSSLSAINGTQTEVVPTVVQISDSKCDPETFSKLVNDEPDPSSPSPSSGIVADITDVIGDPTIQHASSVPSSPSVCEQAYNNEMDDIMGYETSAHRLQVHDSNDVFLVRDQVDNKPKVVDVSSSEFDHRSSVDDSSLDDEKLESNSTSILQNMFNSLADYHLGNINVQCMPSRPLNLASSVCSTNGRLQSGKCDEGNAARKQIICAKLSENYRLIEIAVANINSCTAARSWRQPHILQKHLLEIQENLTNITASLSKFSNIACRIHVDSENPKAQELKRLLIRLKQCSSTVDEICQTLNNTGWTLAALSRPRESFTSSTPSSQDALDRFIELLKQAFFVPNICCEMLQFALMLVPSSSACFLTNGIQNSQSHLSDGTFLPRSLPMKSRDQQKSWSVETISSLNAGTSKAVSSPGNANNDHETNKSDDSNRYGVLSPMANRLSKLILEGRVLEEDDLESMDNHSNNGEINCNHRKLPTVRLRPMPQISIEALNLLSESDKQVIRFYSPQLDTQTDFLSKAIDEFLLAIEDQQPPSDFVQKGKLIILAAHKLIYIGDNIAQCISAEEVGINVRRAADRLCDMLKACVQATKQAADQYPSIPAIQAMVDCIVTVSCAAHDLRILVQQCCG